MAKLNWLYSLLAGHAERGLDSIGEPKAADTRAFENNRHEFMFDSLMDVPFERVDSWRPRQ
jgi:hypothetical protein